MPASLALRGFGLLLLLALAIYLPALRGPFFWDDDELVYQNQDVVSPAGVMHVWWNTAASEYTPLATVSYWFEWGLWKRATLGYHLDNVLLHAVNAFLVWLVLLRLKIPGAFLAAVLFLVHPVCVESVAWISERRNVLSMAFYLLAILGYLRFQTEGRNRDYWLALALFGAALLSKATVVILPVTLLLIVWWVNGRVGRKDVLRMAPLFGLSLVAGALRIWFEFQRGMNAGTLPDSSFAGRAVAASQAVWFYLGEVFWPVHLSLIYPRLAGSPILAAIGAAGLAAALLVLFSKRSGWGRPYLLALCYFLLAIGPALGLLKMAYLQHADVSDHFAYMALIAPLALVAAGASRWGSTGRTLLAAACLVFAGLTLQRSWFFGHPEELWRLTIRQNPPAWTAHEHLAIARYERADIPGAIDGFQRSLELHPSNFRAWFNLGTMRHLQGRYPEAAAAYAQALALNPALVQARERLEACRRTMETVKQRQPER